MSFRLLREFLRICLWFFFRRIELEGDEHVPKTGPLMLVPNHVNALIDPLVIAAIMKRPLTMTARDTLKEHKFLAFLMRTFRVVGFHRAQDGGSMRKNVEAMQECRRRLAQGEALCIFPEGQSHSEPHVRPFKDGAARIALGYLKDHPPDPHLAIIPVGLHFEHKDRLRTRVWVRFGEPIYVDDWKQANPQGDHRALTEDIEEGVRTVTLNFENQEARTLLHWTAEVFATGADVPPRLGQDPETLSQRLHVISQMQIRARLLREEHPENIQKLADQLEGFRRKLRRLAVTPAEVYLSMHPARAIFFILREAELTFVGLPLAVWGAVNHLPALLAVKIVERRLTKADDQWASNTFFAALAIFPIFFLIQLCIVAVLTPLFWTLVYAITVPFGGIYLTMYQDRVGGVIRRSRTFIYFLFHRNAQKRLMEEGRAIVEEIRGLAELPEMT